MRQKCNNCLDVSQKKFWSKSFRSFQCRLGVQILIDVVFLSSFLYQKEVHEPTQLNVARACRLLMFKNAQAVACKTRIFTTYICDLVLFTTKWSHKEHTHSFEVKEYVGELGVVFS